MENWINGKYYGDLPTKNYFRNYAFSSDIKANSAPNNNGLKKQKTGGDINSLGYKSTSPYVNNPYIDIRSPYGNITMNDVNFPILAVDNYGGVQTMYPGNNYKFKGNKITEFPLKFQQGGQTRLVNSVPEGYTFEKQDGNKKYYKKQSSSTLSMANSYGNDNVNDAQYQQWLINKLSSGVSPQELAAKKYISNDEINNYTQYYKPSIDRVYTDFQTPSPQPVTTNPYKNNGKMEEPIYNSAGHIVAEMYYPTSNTNNASDDGMINTQYTSPVLKFRDDFGYTGKQVVLQPSEVQKYLGPTNTIQNDSLYNELINRSAPSLKLGGLTQNKAKEILDNRTANEKQLTSKQKHFMQAVTHGWNPYKMQTGGYNKIFQYIMNDDDDDDERDNTNIDNSAPSEEEAQQQNELRQQQLEEQYYTENASQGAELANFALQNDEENENVSSVQQLSGVPSYLNPYTNYINKTTQTSGFVSDEDRRKKGMTIASYNNNPGNIKFGKFAQRFGAVQGSKDNTGPGYYAYFPDRESGLKAMKTLFTSALYSNLPLEKALHTWSDDPKKTGYGVSKIAPDINANTLVKNLTQPQLDKILISMGKWEGFKQKGGNIPGIFYKQNRNIYN